MKNFIPIQFQHPNCNGADLHPRGQVPPSRYPYAVHRVMSAMYLSISVYCRNEPIRSWTGVVLKCKRSSPNLEKELIARLQEACKEEGSKMCAVMSPERAIYVGSTDATSEGRPPTMNGEQVL